VLLNLVSRLAALQRPGQTIEKVMPLGRGEFSNEDGCVSGRAISRLILNLGSPVAALPRCRVAADAVQSFQQTTMQLVVARASLLTMPCGCLAAPTAGRRLRRAHAAAHLLAL
jgi:hypothetical protein